MTKGNRNWWLLAGSTLLYLATTADGLNFNAALPTIKKYFDASTRQIQLLTTIPQLDHLFEDAFTDFSIRIAQTMLLLAAILLVSGIIIWFGMRNYQSAEEAA